MIVVEVSVGLERRTIGIRPWRKTSLAGTMDEASSLGLLYRSRHPAIRTRVRLGRFILLIPYWDSRALIPKRREDPRETTLEKLRFHPSDSVSQSHSSLDGKNGERASFVNDDPLGRRHRRSQSDH